MTKTINTKTARRRLVAYRSLADIVSDLDRLEAAHTSGTLKRLGNHEPGPVCHHVAMGMKGSFDGFPAFAPLWLRVIGRVMKKHVMSRPFQPGFNLNADAEKLAWSDAIDFAEGLGALRAQISRAGAPGAAPDKPHPFFGDMTPAEWQTYYLRHAELHLSFLQP